MIIFFRRLGFIVPLVVIFSLLFLAILRDSTDFYEGERLMRDLCYLIFSILLPVGLKLNLNLELNEKTHTFYFLRLEVWACIFLALGVYFHFL